MLHCNKDRFEHAGYGTVMAQTPFDMVAAMMKFATAYNTMQLSAAEVIARRTMMMASGAMTAPEAVGMVLENATTFAVAAEKAAVAAAKGADPLRVASAALRPYGTRTRANARKLRR
jgi:hypothetical protein